MQYRHWNWQDNDSTFDMNWRDLILVPWGLYRGFDAVLPASLVLTLTMATTGITKILEDLTESDPMGAWKTKQGAVICEDAPLTFTITATSGSGARYDLIVGEHLYVEAGGGAVALYKVIQGTPGGGVPALTAANKQVILGTLYMPASTSTLNATGVTYTKSIAPNFGTDDSIVHTDRVQEITAFKIMDSQRGFISNSILPIGSVLTMQELSNHFKIASGVLSGPGLVDVITDVNFTVAGYSNGLGKSATYSIYTPGTLKFTNSYGSGGKLLVPSQDGIKYVYAGSNFTVKDITGFDGTSNQCFCILEDDSLERQIIRKTDNTTLSASYPTSVAFNPIPGTVYTATGNKATYVLPAIAGYPDNAVFGVRSERVFTTYIQGHGGTEGIVSYAEFSGATVSRTTYSVWGDETVYFKKLPGATTWLVIKKEGRIPPGMVAIMPSAHLSGSGGWLICNGSGQSTTEFPDLFDYVAYTWGGSGGTFNLPTLASPYTGLEYYIHV